MRSSFYEYYDLSKEEHDKLWDNALLVLDTNVLLSLYRLQSDARKDFLAVINKYKNRLWMPFQVGWEYHEHRLEEACRPVDSLKKLKNRVDDFAKAIEEDYGKHPYLKDIKSLKRTLDSLKDKTEKLIGTSISACPNFLHDDPILNEVSDLYAGKIGNPYTDEHLLDLYKIGEERYEKKIPPGYKDKDKKTGNRHRFGDLIIWMQMLEKAKESDCDMLFVTDDKKEDWWQMYNGDKTGPRRELISEFRATTGNHLIGFYTPDRFLSIANERKDVSVKKATIDEVMKYSDLSRMGMESISGESFQPGQFATDSFLVSFNRRFGESDPGNMAISGIIGEKADLSTGLIFSPVRGKPSRLVGGYMPEPFEMKKSSNDVEGNIEVDIPDRKQQKTDSSDHEENERNSSDSNKEKSE